MAATLMQSAGEFFVDGDYQTPLAELGLDSLAGVFKFQQGENLLKANLAAWRHRIRFQLPDGRYAYLKRYANPPKSVQVKAWLQHGTRSFLSVFDKGPATELQDVDVLIPHVIACGGLWQGLFETKSFIITLEIPDADSLEKKLPDCFHLAPAKSQKNRKDFIVKTADFVRRFHQTGFRHRDLYLCHLFLSDNKTLYLIDLHRTFKPKLLGSRYRLKDIAQLHYSCPADVISLADRLRFFRAYTQTNRLTATHKIWIRKVHAKAVRIARHDRKHGRIVPFEKNSR